MNLIATISSDAIDQWINCKNSEGFAVLQKSVQKWVIDIAPGDNLFVRHAAHGWIAKCKTTSEAKVPNANQRDYWAPKFGPIGLFIPFEIVAEYNPPKFLPFPDFKQKETGISLNLFRKAISRISESEAEKLNIFLSN